jgi:hypothetical protein
LALIPAPLTHVAHLDAGDAASRKLGDEKQRRSDVDLGKVNGRFKLSW